MIRSTINILCNTHRQPFEQSPTSGKRRLRMTVGVTLVGLILPQSRGLFMVLLRRRRYSARRLRRVMFAAQRASSMLAQGNALGVANISRQAPTGRP